MFAEIEILQVLEERLYNLRKLRDRLPEDCRADLSRQIGLLQREIVTRRADLRSGVGTACAA